MIPIFCPKVLMIGIDAIGIQPVLFTNAFGQNLGHLLLAITIALGVLVISSHIITRIIKKYS